MPIEYPEGAPKLNDPRIEKVVEYLGSYQYTLRELFDELSDESKFSLSRTPNPHLAAGPTEVLVCTNGAVATIRNGFESADITIKVVVTEEPNTTMVEYFNSQAERFFTFMDPISKLSSKGHTATFEEGPTLEGNLMAVIVMDRRDRSWFPPASKVFLIGWKFLEHGDFRAKSREAAGASLAAAHGVVNLGSPGAASELLKEYRALLDSAIHESELQTFLEAHPEFVYPEYDQVVPKPSLGDERIPDFAFSIGSASGPRWLFVEIEKPDKPIFTKGDQFQFSHQFTQAKQQLLQWDSLITQDHSYFSKRFPDLLKPEFHLIYGREAELDASRREMLAAEFSSTSNRTFSTFDDLANRFERILTRVFSV